MTYRERREARAERLREWAEKRQERAAATLKSHEVYRGDHAFNTQPGHIPERARVIRQEDSAYASLSKARGMVGRAAGIEHQLDTSIYSDDPDAAEALTARIAGLESERDRIKAINAAARKYKTPEEYAKALAAGQLGAVEITPADARTLAGCAMWGERFKPGFDPYLLQNLGGNIKRYKDRLRDLNEPRSTLRYYYAAKYGGTCVICDGAVEKGSPMYYDRADQTVRHEACFTAKVAV